MEETASEPPIVKSWRDAGDTICRQNHREEAKLWPLHTFSWCRESLLHVKWRNKEGTWAAIHPCPDDLGRRGQGEFRGIVVLPKTTLGQSSIDPWTDRPPPREKEKLTNKQ
jgi:hypothetical protein